MQSNASSSTPERFPRFVWAAVLVTLAVTPLVFSTAMRDVYRLPKTLFFQAAVLFIGASILLWSAFRTGLAERAGRHRTVLILAATALAWTAIVTMTAQNPVVASHAPLTMFCYAVFFSAALLFARRTPGLVLVALLVPALLNVVVLILQWRTIWSPVPHSTTMRRLTHTALQGNPDPAGMYLMIPAIAAVAATIAFRRWRPVLAAASAFLLIGLLLTESITVFVMLASVFVAFMVVVPSRRVRFAMLAMILLGVAVLGLYRPTRMRLTHTAHWMAKGNFQQVTSNRLPGWAAAWTMFAGHPLTGVGPGGYAAKYMSYKLAGDERHPEWIRFGNFNFGEAHNDHLQLLAEAGLPGYALFLAFGGTVALLSRRAQGRSDECARFVRFFAFPAATGFAVAALAQFPMHLTATSSVAIFAAALCHAWGNDAHP